MKTKENSNWQSKQEIAQYLYGFSDGSVVPANIRIEMGPEQQAKGPVKTNVKPVTTIIQWDNQQ